ncbi:MAG: hypothetical protein AAGI53_04540 [Planctomycetota bacterium]
MRLNRFHPEQHSRSREASAGLTQLDLGASAGFGRGVAGVDRLVLVDILVVVLLIAEPGKQGCGTTE